MTFMEKFKKAGRAVVDTGAKTMLKVRSFELLRNDRNLLLVFYFL